MEARIAALESENQQVRKDAAAARAEARALRQRLGATPAAASTTSPALVSAHAMASKAPRDAPASNWAGLYAGAAFGLASMHSRIIDQSISTTNSASTNSIHQVLDNFSSTLLTVNGTSNGRTPGAIANLFLGYNFVLGHNVILGGQVEGGVSNIHVNLDRSFTSVQASTTVVTPPGGAAGTSTFNQVINGTSSSAIANRWLVSALARGGVLITPADYVYGLGGWTYGRFELDNQSFGLNGGTIGAGWERQLAPGWTLRAEGRYTKFQDKTVGSLSSTNTTSSSAGGGATSSGTQASVLSASNRVSADMWSAWLGVTHYFGL